MFEAFVTESVNVGEVTLRVRHAGSGPAVLLLHGHPRTSATWHCVAPRLLDFGYAVVCPDLRGYGKSSKPETTADHAPYSKRAMAGDMVPLMRQLGHDRFAVAGHDRGSYVALRLALDNPQVVRRLAVLDSVPSAKPWRGATTGSPRPGGTGSSSPNPTSPSEPSTPTQARGTGGRRGYGRRGVRGVPAGNP